ncbi:copper chaperone PCu(A)C [soil metagenome]
MKLHSIQLATGGLLICASAFAHEYKAGDLVIQHPHARATVPGQASGGAYIGLENTGKDSDTLVSANSPVARSVELHTMSMQGDVMRMRQVQEIELKPSAKIVMKPGDGYHMMLLGLNRELKAGDKFPLTLNFAKAGKVEVTVHVDSKDAKPAETMMAPAR